jgi:hypothetical protein
LSRGLLPGYLPQEENRCVKTRKTLRGKKKIEYNEKQKKKRSKTQNTKHKKQEAKQNRTERGVRGTKKIEGKAGEERWSG